MGSAQDVDRKAGPLGQAAQLFAESRIGVRFDGLPGGIQRLVGESLGIARLHALEGRVNELDGVPLGQLSQFLSHLVGRSPHHDDGNRVFALADGREIPVSPRNSNDQEPSGDSTTTVFVCFLICKLSKSALDPNFRPIRRFYPFPLRLAVPRGQFVPANLFWAFERPPPRRRTAGLPTVGQAARVHACRPRRVVQFRRPAPQLQPQSRLRPRRTRHLRSPVGMTPGRRADLIGKPCTKRSRTRTSTPSAVWPSGAVPIITSTVISSFSPQAEHRG